MAKAKPDKQTAKNGAARKAGRTGTGKFARGNGGGPGRPVGTPNPISARIKADIVRAYEERGGKEYLAGLSDPLFVGLLGRVLPRESLAASEDRQPLQVSINIESEVVQLLQQAYGGGRGLCPGLRIGAGQALPVLEVEPVDNENGGFIDQ